VVGAQVVKNNVILARKTLSLIYKLLPGSASDDFSKGELFNVFEKWSKDKLLTSDGKALSDYIISGIKTDSRGILKVGTYLGRFIHFPEASVEIKVIDNRPCFLRFVQDRNGNPILDKDGRHLVIGLCKSKDSKTKTAQILERILFSPFKRTQSLKDILRKAKESFFLGKYKEAAELSARIIYLMNRRQKKGYRLYVWEEIKITQESRLYIEFYRRLKKARLKDKKLFSLQNIFEESKALYRKGRLKEAIHKIKRVIHLLSKRQLQTLQELNLLKEADAGLEFLLELQRQNQIESLFLKAEQYFSRRQYKIAMRKFKELNKKINPLSKIAILIQNYISKCEEEISGRKNEMTPISIRFHYNEINILSAEKEKELLEGILKNNSEARSIFVENYIWLVKKVASNYANPQNGYYEELVQEGILALYDIVDDYARIKNKKRIPFKDYAEDKLKDFYKKLRKENHRFSYNHSYLDAPLKGKLNNHKEDDFTLHDVLTEANSHDEPEKLMVEKLDFLNGNFYIDNAQLKRVFERLSLLEKRVLVVYILEEFHPRLICNYLGISESEFFKILNKSMRKIHQIIQKDNEKSSGSSPVKERFHKAELSLDNLINSYIKRCQDSSKKIHSNEIEFIRNIYNWVYEKYKDKKFPSGETYWEHALKVAYTLAGWCSDAIVITAALAHKLTKEDIEFLNTHKAKQIFGNKELLEKLYKLLKRFTFIDMLPYRGYGLELSGARTIQNYMNMLIQLCEDLDMLLLVFADKLEGVPISADEEERQYRYREVMEVFVPLAERLNAYNISRKLRDKAFRFYNPFEYALMETAFEVYFGNKYEEAHAYLENKINELNRLLMDRGINFINRGRIKSLFNIKDKIDKEHSLFEEFFKRIWSVIFPKQEDYEELGAMMSLLDDIAGMMIIT
ncbi:MAG: HD domain-containing protein, partial [Candidatus Omnitrophica bacterium]|nr:HD domain-containing protein [Candidatus Omnitrophota bacterium]